MPKRLIKNNGYPAKYQDKFLIFRKNSFFQCNEVIPKIKVMQILSSYRLFFNFIFNLKYIPYICDFEQLIKKKKHNFFKFLCVFLKFFLFAFEIEKI